MIKRKIILGLIGLLMLSFEATAQTSSAPTMRLSLQEAQQYAIEHNNTMLNASLDVQKAEAARWQAISTMLPQVKAGFDYSNMCGYKMEMQGFSIPMNPNGTFSLTASMALTGAQIMSTMLSSLSMEMSDITKQQTEQSIASQVKNVYVSILVMEETSSLLDSSLANMERLEKTTIAAVKVGASEQVDADKLSVQVASLRNSINSTRRSLAMLYNSLILQLGADVNSNLVLTTKMDELINIDNASQLLQQPFNIENNYNYQLLQKNEELSKKQLTMAWMDFTPTLSAYYQYSKKTYFNKDAGMNMTPPNMVGASISLPLWQTGTRAASIKQAQINYNETLNSKKQAEDALKVQYNQLCYDLISALESYRIQDANLDVTKRVFDNVTNKYKYGRASSLEVTNSSTDLITAQSNYIQAVMSVISAQVALEVLINKQ